MRLPMPASRATSAHHLADALAGVRAGAAAALLAAEEQRSHMLPRVGCSRIDILLGARGPAGAGGRPTYERRSIVPPGRGSPHHRRVLALASSTSPRPRSSTPPRPGAACASIRTTSTVSCRRRRVVVRALEGRIPELTFRQPPEGDNPTRRNAWLSLRARSREATRHGAQGRLWNCGSTSVTPTRSRVDGRRLWFRSSSR